MQKQSFSGVFSGDLVPEIYHRYIFPFNMKKFAEEVGRQVILLQPQHILEVAAGTGAASECVLKQLDNHVSYTLTDLGEGVLEAARFRFDNPAYQKPDMSIATADACQLPYDDKSFDTVICQFGLMHFQNQQSAFNEMYRVLTPDGFLVMSVWDSLEYHTFSQVFHRLLF